MYHDTVLSDLICLIDIDDFAQWAHLTSLTQTFRPHVHNFTAQVHARGMLGLMLAREAHHCR